MARTLTANQAAEIATTQGTEPLFIVEVHWGKNPNTNNPTILKYCSRKYGGCSDKLISIEGLQTVITLGGGSTGQVSIVLQDFDSIILDIMNSQDVNRSNAFVYQAFGDLTENEKFLIFEGEVSTPLVWSEKDRTVSFDIVNFIEQREIGFSPDQASFPFLDRRLIGKVWPLCFGDVSRVPCVKYTSSIVGQVSSNYGIITEREFYRATDIAIAASKIQERTRIKFEKHLNDETDWWTDTSFHSKVRQRTAALIALEKQRRSFKAQAPNRQDKINEYFDKLLQWSDSVFVTGAAALPVDHMEELIDLYQELREARFNPIIIDNGAEDWPQGGGSIEVFINNARLRGTMSGNVFTPTSPMLPKYTDLDFGERQTTENNKFWVTDSRIILKDCWVLVEVPETTTLIDNNGWFLLRVVDQQGTECTYEKMHWIYDRTATTLASAVEGIAFRPNFGTIREVSPMIRKDWRDANKLNITDYISSRIFPLHSPRTWNINWRNNLFVHVWNDDWGYKTGDTIYQVPIGGGLSFLPEQQEKYIAHWGYSDSVHEVLASRTINGVTSLQPLPDHYYTAKTDDNLHGHIATTITLDQPLKSRKDEHWGDQVFVSLKSSLPGDPTEIIKYAIDTFTDLTYDSTTFDQALENLGGLQAGFVLTSKRNAIDFIKDVAFQSKSVLTISNGVVKMFVLSKEESVVKTLTEIDILVNSLEIHHTSTEQIATRLKSQFQLDNSDEPIELYFRNNIPLYGLIERNINLNIYNSLELVQHVLTFYGIRMSNMWKRVKFTTFLQNLDLELYDVIKLDIGDNKFWGTDKAVKIVIESIQYDTKNFQLIIEGITPIKAGRSSEYVHFWPTSGEAFPTDDDEFVGVDL